jgi:hypothetical protein
MYTLVETLVKDCCFYAFGLLVLALGVPIATDAVVLAASTLMKTIA